MVRQGIHKLQLPERTMVRQTMVRQGIQVLQLPERTMGRQTMEQQRIHRLQLPERMMLTRPEQRPVWSSCRGRRRHLKSW